MDISIDQNSKTPLYKQIVNAIKKMVEKGVLKDGDPLPSMHELSADLGVSMETAKKSYNYLKNTGFLAGQQGKGVYVCIRDGKLPKRILLIFDKLSPYKLEVYRSFLSTLKIKAEVTILFHSQNIDHLARVIDEEVDNYDYYLITANFKKDVPVSKIVKLISRIPNDKLIVLDRNLQGIRGHVGCIYQDFIEDPKTGLREGIDLIRKYDTVRIVDPGNGLYSDDILKSIRDFFDEEGISNFFADKGFIASTMQKSTLYIVLGGQLDHDHYKILRAVNKKGFTLGKEVGLIIYNDQPLNEFISGGLSCLSTDFEGMGENAARMINNGKMEIIHNSFHLVKRNSV